MNNARRLRSQGNQATLSDASGAALCQIALVFDAKAALVPGTVLALTVTKAKVIPEDIGAVDDDPYFLDKKLNLADIQLKVGTVVVN